MGQKRVDSEGIKSREKRVASIEKQISIWEATAEKTRGMDLLREASAEGIKRKQKEIMDRVKSLAFSSEADRLDLAKLGGSLDELESVYYDIADATKKIDGARQLIAGLVEEIRRAKKGELLETRA